MQESAPDDARDRPGAAAPQDLLRRLVFQGLPLDADHRPPRSTVAACQAMESYSQQLKKE
jgi:hypothetical protein